MNTDEAEPPTDDHLARIAATFPLNDDKLGWDTEDAIEAFGSVRALYAAVVRLRARLGRLEAELLADLNRAEAAAALDDDLDDEASVPKRDGRSTGGGLTHPRWIAPDGWTFQASGVGVVRGVAMFEGRDIEDVLFDLLAQDLLGEAFVDGYEPGGQRGDTGEPNLGWADEDHE